MENLVENVKILDKFTFLHGLFLKIFFYFTWCYKSHKGIMKIRLIILFLIVFFITPNVKAMSSITSLFVHEPFLWSVEKDGKVSYFFGTVHFPIPLIDIPCSHIITEEIQTSELMFLETLDDATERINRYTKAITASHLSEDSSDFQSLSTEAQSFLRDKKILNTQMTYMGYMLSLMLKRNIEAQNTFDRNSIGILDDQIKRNSDVTRYTSNSFRL